MIYPGGKGGAGIAQAIINQMPPHEIYIEPFAGGAAVFRAKRPAAHSILIEIDRDQADKLHFAHGSAAELHNTDAIAWLGLRGIMKRWTGRELVYADPPYLLATRVKKKMYAHELTDEDHIRLLDVLKSLPCAVMISGYASPLYVKRLKGWRVVTFTAMTRGGKEAVEHLWMNFAEPKVLHDYQYLGADFRERERIKRKAARWKAKLDAMPALERQAVLSAALADIAAQLPPSPAPARTDSVIVKTGDAGSRAIETAAI